MTNDEKTPKHAAQEDEGVLEQDAPEASAPSSDESGPKHAAHAAEEAAPAKSKMFAIVALIAALIVVALVIAGFATGFIGGSAPSQQSLRPPCGARLRSAHEYTVHTDRSLRQSSEPCPT